MLTGRARKKYDEDMVRRRRRALDALAPFLDEQGARNSMHQFLVRFNADGTVTRKRNGVQYTENEKPCKVLCWRPHLNRILVFKHRAGKDSHRGTTNYYPGGVLVCLVSDQPMFPDEDWYLAWSLCEWEHTRSTYTDPQKGP